MKTWIIFIVLSLFAFLPKQVFAHIGGQSFFKINGSYAGTNPLLQVASTSLFSIPQDIASNTYFVNQPLTFAIDLAILQPAISQNPTFFWDFDDGTTGRGIENRHTYTKMGSHIVTIYAQYGQDTEKQLIESVLITIIPTKEYTLPKAVIMANGKEVSDPLNHVLYLDLSQPVQLNAEQFISSSKIVSYQWDLGDGNVNTQSSFSHTYNPDSFTGEVLLRVKDANGFISDAFMQMKQQTNNNHQSSSGFRSFPRFLSHFTILVSFILILIIFGLFTLFRKIRRKIKK